MLQFASACGTPHQRGFTCRRYSSLHNKGSITHRFRTHLNDLQQYWRRGSLAVHGNHPGHVDLDTVVLGGVLARVVGTHEENDPSVDEHVVRWAHSHNREPWSNSSANAPPARRATTNRHVPAGSTCSSRTSLRVERQVVNEEEATIVHAQIWSAGSTRETAATPRLAPTRATAPFHSTLQVTWRWPYSALRRGQPK